MLMQTYYKEICYLQQKYGYLQLNTLQYAAKCIAFCR